MPERRPRGPSTFRQRDLAAALAATPNDGLAFVAKLDGTAYTKESFGNQFREWCDAAGTEEEKRTGRNPFAGYSAHGIRKYAATLRANLGATVNELMAWFGWLSEREATRYTREADRLRLAIGLGQKVNAELAHRETGEPIAGISC